MYDKDLLRKKFAAAIRPFLFALDRRGVRPSQVTVFGLVFTLAACVSYYLEHIVLTFVLMFVGRCCDIVDGALARTTDQVSEFGGFLDSVTDRYGEFAIVATVLFVYRDQAYLYPFSFLVFLGISLMSYTRALYAKYGYQCPGNPFEYFERNLLMVFFFLLGRLDLWLVLVAAGTNLFVLQRIHHFSGQTG